MTNLTETKILEAFEAAGHEYLDMDDLTETRDTLADFREAAKGYAECGALDDETYCGFPALEMNNVQVKKGALRRVVTVIDFGDVRYSYS